MGTDVDAARAVEEASAAFLNATTPEQRSAAEQWLLEARKWPNALAVCHHILVHSTVGYARLQALYMARECLGKQWQAMSQPERAELQLLLLRQQTDANTEHYVRAAAAQMLAVHAKHDTLHRLAAGEAARAAEGAMETLISAARQMLQEASGAQSLKKQQETN